MRPTVSLLAALSVPAGAQAAPAPPERALYTDGPNGRHLLESGWTTRADPRDAGRRRGWHRLDARAEFRPVQVPHSFNAVDRSARGFRSRVQWYRLSFDVPPGAASGWKLRFESVNARAEVFLNARRIGSHEGAHLPFELPARGLRRARNELVVRVDGRGSRTDLPPSDRPSGWWNHGGILREVYLRRVTGLDLADLDVRAQVGDPARATIGAIVRNASRRALPGSYTYEVRGPDGTLLRTDAGGVGRIRPGALGRIATSFSIDRPQLWSPDRPALYELRLRLGGGQETVTHFGVRSIGRDAKGGALLNGRPLSLRGASFHEQTAAGGGALTPADRDEIVAELQRLGADFARQHYPPHPALLEAFDRAGILFWEQIPVWRLRGEQLQSRAVRSEALSRMREAVLRDRNHASVLAWSAANETLRGGRPEARYLRDAKRVVRRLDPTRLFAVDTSLRPLADIPAHYRDLDAIGVTEYLGWYGGAVTDLRPDLARVRARFPGQALFVTELGAEANRDGPASEKGSFAFQRDFLDSQLRAIDAAPEVSGALVWLLRDFAVRPGWEGGNPRPAPPVNFKGVFTERGAPKPAFETVRASFTATPPTR